MILLGLFIHFVFPNLPFEVDRFFMMENEKNLHVHTSQYNIISKLSCSWENYRFFYQLRKITVNILIYS